MQRFGAAGAALVALLWAANAAASEHLTGIVLTLPSPGQVLIHHESFGGMPAMTMSFRVPAQARLNPGDQIGADVDRSSEPWSLAQITTQAVQSVAAAAPPPPLARVGDRVPDAAFVDQRGRPLSLHTLRGAPLAISFIYTRCGDAKMCPLVSAKFHALQQHLPAHAARVEISLDPVYDRPPTPRRSAPTRRAGTCSPAIRRPFSTLRPGSASSNRPPDRCRSSTANGLPSSAATVESSASSTTPPGRRTTCSPRCGSNHAKRTTAARGASAPANVPTG